MANDTLARMVAEGREATARLRKLSADGPGDSGPGWLAAMTEASDAGSVALDMDAHAVDLADVELAELTEWVAAGADLRAAINESSGAAMAAYLVQPSN